MHWPRLQLTPEEGKYSSKYNDPRSNKAHVLRRMYYNQLNIGPTLRIDSVQFQISRRCRVFGITAAGDVSQFKIEIIDSTGEQYTAGPINLSGLLGGWSRAPGSANTGPFGGHVSAYPVPIALTDGPFIQEPNIVLAPNQSLSINATPADTSDLTSNWRIGLNLHVYEFPGMPGSPL